MVTIKKKANFSIYIQSIQKWQFENFPNLKIFSKSSIHCVMLQLYCLISGHPLRIISDVQWVNKFPKIKVGRILYPAGYHADIRGMDIRYPVEKGAG